METVRAAFPGVHKIPDPAFISTAPEWWFLNHVSSSLFVFNPKDNRFDGVLADTWDVGEHYVQVRLRDDAKFSDNSPILADDLIATVKRIIIRRSSTHFPIWKYLRDCESIQSIQSECEGIEKIGDREVRFNMTQRSESFFLLFGSPEGAIWSRVDISADGQTFTPTKYSGPYFLSKIDGTKMVLQKNSWHPFHRVFVNSPGTIIASDVKREGITAAFEKNEIDVAVEGIRPLDQRDEAGMGLSRHLTEPSTMLYFFRFATSTGPVIGADFVKRLWADPLPRDVKPADGFLPFAQMGKLSRSDILAALPPTTSKKLRLAAINASYTPPFLAFLRERAESCGIQIESFDLIDYPTFYKWVSNPGLAKDYDFVLFNYVASERFPAVQLRFLMQHHTAPFDLSLADLPTNDPSRNEILKKTQAWLLENQIVIPFYFVPTQIVYRTGIKIGEQPVLDADLQLWRINSE